MADPQASDADDEGLSRLLDGDLDVAEAAALGARLDAEPALRERLAAMRNAQELVRAVPAPPPGSMDALLQRALAAFDEGEPDGVPQGGAPSSDGPAAPVTSLGEVRARRRTGPLRRNLLGLSAAAALVLVVALAAVAIRIGERGTTGGSDTALAESTFDEQRSSAKAGAAAADAAASSPAAASAELDATEALSSSAGNAPPTTTAPPTTAASATTVSTPPYGEVPPTTLAGPARFDSVAALVDAVRSGSLTTSASGTAAADCPPTGDDLRELAIVEGRVVRWGVRTDPGGTRIVVLDPAGCTVLAEQPR